ncbi:MAG: beta-lactamase family protein [Chloroflexi bacterium]|nr:beta-lactamase family protein [Chloroflexota bacterium]
MKPRSRLFIVLIASLALLSACGPTVQTTPPTIAPAPTAAPAPTVAPTPAPTVATRSDAVIATEIDNYIGKLVNAKLFNGVVLVARDGNIIFEQGYGMADREAQTPITDRTQFYLGSLNKPFTAAAILLLQQDGKLNVNDPICTYLPDCPDSWQPITIHQLLTHTGGFPFSPGISYAKPVTPAELQAAITRVAPAPTPGAFSYSDTSYILAGRIVEQVSGMPYEAFLQTRIFDPLGMTDTGYGTTALRLARGYTSATVAAEMFEPTVDYAAGGVYSTVEDLLRWDQALYTDTPLSAASRAQMFTAQTPIDVDVDYGYGWVLENYKNHRLIWHGGAVPGCRGLLARYVDDRITIIILANQETFDIDTVRPYISDIVLDIK